MSHTSVCSLPSSACNFTESSASLLTTSQKWIVGVTTPFFQFWKNKAAIVLTVQSCTPFVAVLSILHCYKLSQMCHKAGCDSIGISSPVQTLTHAGASKLFTRRWKGRGRVVRKENGDGWIGPKREMGLAAVIPTMRQNHFYLFP